MPRAITEVRIGILAHGKGWIVEEGYTEYRVNEPVFVSLLSCGCPTWASVLARLAQLAELPDHSLTRPPMRWGGPARLREEVAK